MSAYKTLFTELDRSDYTVDYLYTGKLENYSYNDITYQESAEAYSRRLEKLYIDFLTEWDELSDAARKAAKGMVELIVSRRYLYGCFFFDVPSSETIDAMSSDYTVPRQSVKMARFVHDMAEQQKFYLERVVEFMEIVLVKEDLYLKPVAALEEETDLKKMPLEKVDDENQYREKEWITYDELIEKYDFRGVKSAKDASWRKKNGFDKCVSQTGGKGSAVKYSVTRINEWLINGKVSKR